MNREPTDKFERVHRYKIGQSVTLVGGFGYEVSRNNQTVYEIIALLPSNGAHYQYRISNQGERFERVAAENEIELRQGL